MYIVNFLFVKNIVIIDGIGTILVPMAPSYFSHWH